MVARVEAVSRGMNTNMSWSMMVWLCSVCLEMEQHDAIGVLAEKFKFGQSTASGKQEGATQCSTPDKHGNLIFFQSVMNGDIGCQGRSDYFRCPVSTICACVRAMAYCVRVAAATPPHMQHFVP
jgi:hypothetical protein